MICRFPRSLLIGGHHILPRQANTLLKSGLIDARKESQFLGISENRPRQSARPRAERRIPLLRAAAAEVPIIAIEDPFVRRAAADVVGVGRIAVKNDVLIGA